MASSKPSFAPYSPIIGTTPAPFSPIATAFDEKTELHTNIRHHRMGMVLTALVTIVLIYLVVSYDELKSVGGELAMSVLIGLLLLVLAQLINQFYRRMYSMLQIAKFFVWGCINGVLTSLWIDMLFFQCPNTVSRVLVDQLIGLPMFQLTFLVMNAIWDNNSDIKTYLKINYVRSLKLSYLIWPCFSIISFSILPAHLIFPCNCLVNLGWNVVLSFIA